MNTTRPPSAMRELRHHLVQPVPFALLAMAALVLTLMGAFGTGVSLPFAERLGYWALIVVSTYCVGYLASESAWMQLRGRMPDAAIVAVAAAATGIGVTLTVLLVNGLVFGRWLAGEETVSTLATIFVIAALVSAAIHLVQMQGAAAATDPEGPPPILERVPLEKRGALVALSVEDHYVRIRTTRGEEMVLMRLGDAIREAAPETGLRVHRSHWVALAQVRTARRDGDRAILGMAAGDDIPASRSHIPALKEAGLLPR